MSLQTAQYQATQRDLTFMFHEAAEAATPFHPLLAMMIKSNSSDEKYGWLGASPGMREWLGPREFKQLRAADYTLANKHWESSQEFEKIDVDDDRTGGFRNRIANLATEATYHPDELLLDVITTAHTKPCYDGQFFFDTDHQWGDSGTQSNDLSSSAVLPSNPTSVEFKDSFHEALINMLGLKNDQGKHFIRPTVGKLGDLVCLVPLNMYTQATKAFTPLLAVEGDGAHSNFQLETPTIIPVQRMPAGATWHLYHTGGSLKPYIFQAREPLKFNMKGADDIEFKVLKAMTEARYNIGFGAWFSAARVTFS